MESIIIIRNENANLLQQLAELKQMQAKEDHYKTEKLSYKDINNFYTAEDLARYKQKMSQVDGAAYRHAKQQQEIRYKVTC